MIDGVIVTPLTTHADDRGYFREIARFSADQLKECRQLSATMSYAGVIKAFHYHEHQNDLWYCAKGMILVVLYDRREGSPSKGTTQTVAIGDACSQTVFIPKGVVHGYKVLGAEPALVVYATDREYDPKDELRLAHDDPAIGFDWELQPR